MNKGHQQSSSILFVMRSSLCFLAVSDVSSVSFCVCVVQATSVRERSDRLAEHIGKGRVGGLV